ncbi:GntR family transcriptional regulator [Agromyces kandeliae]|nr:GntR family transcriptional regulator [Agromyces kandeliae]
MSTLTTGRPSRPSRVDEAFDFIAERIFAQDVRPGDFLRIDAIAGELDMSITPVREALNRIAAVGLAQADANRGYRVAPLLDTSAFHRLFSARHAIEMAAARGTDDQPNRWVRDLDRADVDRLGELVDRMGTIEHDSSYQQYSEYSRLDGLLHREFMRLSGNEFLLTAWQSLHFHMHVSRLYTGVGVIDFDEAQAEHHALVDALRERDGELFVFLCDKHIRRAEQRLSHLLPSLRDSAAE